MFITAERIQRLAPHVYLTIAEAIAPIIEAEMPKWGVDTLLRRGHFMGQACWESAHFSRFEENMNYTAVAIAAVWPRLASRAAALAGNPQAIANAAYAGRNGNGDEDSGDGWTFRGRGLLEITGRRNYLTCGVGLAQDLINNPGFLSTPDGAVRSALWFWQINGCNHAADNDDAEAVTRIINGPARDHLTARRELTESAKAIFA